ncbi:uncharacterized protein PHALS_06751 [Plasmopara halstedii]|uniref:Uncharacterized protein n=1 Tax=Plasmopara halstedii TaxID=4781 RepID=A0A0P1B2K3_PLAHL|nr:uncharacterized protein PHALS_06751 [Plasmopara halstedii]CEG48961.1 hypothetical protein PHALS_06751 [Plasmopara halstedii]|eukprot:XP_024585330.1 hypothetical protein PHALS_06751 [Plasmopara halstedii]
MEEPTAAEKSFEDFFIGVNDVAQKVNKQREFRREDSNRRRQEMAAKFADEVMKESEKAFEIETPPSKSPTDKRATKRAAKRAEESITRQLFQDSDVRKAVMTKK